MSDAEALEKFALVPNEVLNTEGIAGGNLLTWSSEFHRTGLVKYLLDWGADPFFREGVVAREDRTGVGRGRYVEPRPGQPGCHDPDLAKRNWGHALASQLNTKVCTPVGHRGSSKWPDVSGSCSKWRKRPRNARHWDDDLPRWQQV